jgi:transmembrane sensor
MNDRFAELLSRKLSGEATPDEIRELYDYLQANAGDQYFAEILLSYWNTAHDARKELAPDDDKHFEHILLLAGQSPDAETEQPDEETPLPAKSSYTSWKTWMAAASLLAVLTTAAFLFFRQLPAKTIVPSAEKGKNEIIARRGAKSYILLPDGSRVWLNSDSKLSYGKFNDTLREVELEGEAFFDVVKQKKRPFIVHTSGIAIHVLGTAFNVKSYADESVIETTLIRGLIEVERNDQPLAKHWFVLPHQKLVYNKQENSMATSSTAAPIARTVSAGQQPEMHLEPLPTNRADSALKETSWVYNRLLFDGDTFRELAGKMERWFNVKIVLKNELLAAQRLHGSFENETIEQAMEALKVMTPCKYKINDNEVEIDKK